MKRSASAAVAVGAVTILLLTSCSSSNELSGGETATLPTSGDELVVEGETVADAELWADAQGGSLSVGTVMQEQDQQQILDAFTEDTGIQSEMFRLPAPQLVERILSEAGAGQISYDAVHIVPQPANELSEQEIFVPYDSPLAEVATDRGEAWIAPFFNLLGICYNSESLPDGVSIEKYEDLIDPALQGRIGLVNANAAELYSGQYVMIDERLKDGEKWMRDLAAQDTVVYDTVAVAAPALASGEIDVLFSCPLVVGVSLINNGAPIEFVTPSEGAYASAASLGITSSGIDNPAAKVYYNWVLSKRAQAIFASQGTIPTRGDLEDLPEPAGIPLPSPSDPSFWVYTEQQQKDNQARVLTVWNDAFGYLG